MKSFFTLCLLALCGFAHAADPRPNFVIILADDLRYQSLGSSGNREVITPRLDALAREGARFSQCFVTLSICSPSRAAYLTGCYGNRNGVTTLAVAMKPGTRTIAHALAEAGYRTATMGKWHLKTTPEEAGFKEVSYFYDNGEYYGREVMTPAGITKVSEHIDAYTAKQAATFLSTAGGKDARPFLLFINLQLPHLAMHEEKTSWDPRPEAAALYKNVAVSVPPTWGTGLGGKPTYLDQGRPHQKAIDEYGYDNPENVIKNLRNYYSVITDMDTEVGRILDAVAQHGLTNNTYIFFVSDNGYLIGEFQLTSKVLPFEPSIRTPMLVKGPGVIAREVGDLVLNIDLAPTLAELARLPPLADVDGRSVVPILKGQTATGWREQFLYECPQSALGVEPHFAVRTKRWKYIETFDSTQPNEARHRELYDLEADPQETRNLSGNEEQREIESRLDNELKRLRTNPSGHHPL